MWTPAPVNQPEYIVLLDPLEEALIFFFSSFESIYKLNIRIIKSAPVVIVHTIYCILMFITDK